MSSNPLRSKTLGLSALLVLTVAGCDPLPSTPVNPPGAGGSAGGSSATGGRGGTAGSGNATGGSTGTGGSGTAGSGTAGTGGQAGAGGSGGSTGGATAGTGGATGGGGDSAPRPDTGSFEAGPNPELDRRCTVPVTFRNQAATTQGGMIFNREIPMPEATMQEIARKVCRVLYRQVSEVKNVNSQTLTIDTHDGVAFAGGGGINFSANYIGSYSQGKQPATISFELHGVLAHESTHVWQYTNGGGWLVEAMADYVRYRGGYDRLSRRGPGGNWNSPYTTGGFFIVWIEDKYDKDFGYKVNMGMKNQGFNYANFVQQITGKPIDMVWQEYQAEIRR
jgi:hypothetical protein